MKPDDELIPLKQIAGALGVSRPTLWRMSKAVAGFPAPLVVRKRVYWRADALPALREALARFQGRGVFEKERRIAKLRAVKRSATAPKRPARRPDEDDEPDLFGELSVGKTRE